MSDAQLDTRAAQSTPRATIAHLCECYEAYLAHLSGTPWEWGSYSADATLDTLWQTRAKAVEAACSAGTDDALRTAHAYIVAHDAYHVGQLCLVHLQTNPDWDPYSIYKP